jgi:hypothetical protein
LQDRYFKHRQEILINRERANLPGLQDLAIREKKRRELKGVLVLIQNQINELDTVQYDALMEYNTAYRDYEASKASESDSKEDKERFRKVMLEKKEEVQRIRQHIIQKRGEYQKTYVRTRMTDEEFEEEEKEGAEADAELGSAAAGRKKEIHSTLHSRQLPRLSQYRLEVRYL